MLFINAICSYDNKDIVTHWNCHIMTHFLCCLRIPTIPGSNIVNFIWGFNFTRHRCCARRHFFSLLSLDAGRQLDLNLNKWLSLSGSRDFGGNRAFLQNTSANQLLHWAVNCSASGAVQVDILHWRKKFSLLLQGNQQMLSWALWVGGALCWGEVVLKLKS